LNTQTSRKRVVELMHEATAAPYQMDDGWVSRFMELLQQEDPTLANEVVKAAHKRSKGINDNTI